MKKLIFTGSLLAVLGVMIGCNKFENTPTQTQTENTKIEKNATATVVINENNIGDYHNQTVQYLFNDLARMKNEDLLNSLKSPQYITGKMKQFCTENNIQLPSDADLNKMVVGYASVTTEQLIANKIFTNSQRVILTDAFNSVSIVNDASQSQTLINLLDSKLVQLKALTNDSGRKIAIAIINQLKSSTIFWIQQGNINFLNGKGYFEKAKKPSNGDVLVSDARGMGFALACGGWSNPIGWCGSMFWGAGASIGRYVDSPWWPY